jgi:hypothetical protein
MARLQGNTMSKRFPIPSFVYEPFKNLDWKEPRYRDAKEQARLLDSALSGDQGVIGGYAVRLEPAFCERFKLRGAHQYAVMCLLPGREVHVIGRSHAWAIQQALIVDSIDSERAKVLYEWKTPRPMNTRLGPDQGVTLSARAVYVVCSHRYADYWIVNRTLVDTNGFAGASGYGVLSASDDDINDFHACNVWFNWQ